MFFADLAGSFYSNNITCFSLLWFDELYTTQKLVADNFSDYKKHAYIFRNFDEKN